MFHLFFVIYKRNVNTFPPTVLWTDHETHRSKWMFYAEHFYPKLIDLGFTILVDVRILDNPALKKCITGNILLCFSNYNLW